MSARGRAGGERSERVLGVDDATVGRAGDAATRLALEETLLRHGWRLLWFDDRFGPLFGPRRSKVIDGVAVRLRPGEEEELELRLIRFESGTLELPPGLIERVQRVAGGTTPAWIVAAFDGERLRLVPDPDALGEPLPPRAVLEERPGGRPRGRIGAPEPTPSAARAEAGAATAVRAGAGTPLASAPEPPSQTRRPARVRRGGATREPTRAAAGSAARRPSRQTPTAPLRGSGPDAEAAPPEGRSRRRGRGSAAGRVASPPQAAPAPEPAPQVESSEGGRRRRRGKRGGRRRSSRGA